MYGTHEDIPLDFIDGGIVFVRNMIGCNEHPETANANDNTLTTGLALINVNAAHVLSTYH